MFAQDQGRISMRMIEQDLTKGISWPEELDYVIHGASITQSQAMVDHPLEVISINVEGTKYVMELAAQKAVKSAVYLSSMEVYGFTTQEELLDETNLKYVNPLLVRSCYPESKRMAENLCIAYMHECGVPVRIIRLGQTFGYGVEKNDSRVFAEFARCVRDGKDIRLLTPGDSTRMYLDTIDAVTGILTVLLKGKDGEAYNAANSDTYCSIVDMAHLIVDTLSKGHSKVVYSEKGNTLSQFSPPHRLRLDTEKIEALGWKPITSLTSMYDRLMEEME